jgi:hypothetical protein
MNCYNYSELGHLAYQCTKPKKKSLRKIRMRHVKTKRRTKKEYYYHKEYYYDL